MRAAPDISRSAGIVAKSSETDAMRRELLRGMAAGVLATGATTVLMSQRVQSTTRAQALLYVGEELARYGFPDGHPLGAHRQVAIYQQAPAPGLLAQTH